MPYVEVWVEPENVEFEELDSDDMIDELERRGFKILDRNESQEVFKLYQTWLSCKDSNYNRFEKELKEFFAKSLNKVSV